jgi:hypothetical protein
MKNFKYWVLRDFNIVIRQSDGPAIKGGCVTWRSHPATYPGTLAEIYPGGKPGMACFLPSRHKLYCVKARSRYKFSSGRVFIQVYEIDKRPAAQCRGISYPGATNCLGIESFITCRCAYPGLSPLQIYLASRLSGCKRLKRKRKVRAHTQHLVFARLAFTSPSKKHDKQLTFIVRVSWREYVKIGIVYLKLSRSTC